MKIWKLVGLAGVVGMAAGGVVMVKRRRAREWNDYSSDEVRRRLHERFAASAEASSPAADH